MGEEIGTKEDFDGLFMNKEAAPEGEVAKPEGEEAGEVQVEAKPEETDLEVKPVETEAGETGVEAKPEEKPEDKKPELPEDYNQAIQFQQQFQQFIPLINGVMGMSEADKQALYRKMQGGAAPSQQQAGGVQGPENPLLSMTEEQIKDADEYQPGLGTTLKNMAQELTQIKAEQGNTNQRFKTQADVDHQERSLRYANNYEKQWTQLKKEHPELDDSDRDYLKTLGHGILQAEINKGNLNAEINLYDMGIAHIKRTEDMFNRKNKKPSADGLDKPGVQNKPPDKLPIEVEKEYDKASSMDDVFDTMMKDAGK